LFIDELGTANVNDFKSSLYILAGCSINEEERIVMKTWADKIKFKYWGHTDIVFHSREIGRKENDFAILKDKKIFDDFLKDLEQFLLHSRFKMFFVILYKELKVDYKKIQETLTSISFVTKNNFDDIEEQIADLFAYAAKCKYLRQQGKRVKNGSYEKMMLDLLKNKIFKKPLGARYWKMKYFKEVDSFVVLPQ